MIKTITKTFHKTIDKIIAKDANEEKLYLFITMTTGILAAVVTTLIHHVVFYLRELLGTDQTFTQKSFLLGGIAIFISGWLTTRKFPFTVGSGVPQVKIALAVYNGRIKLGSTIAKFFTTVLSLGSGVSLGREGPSVAVSAGIGSYLGEIFHLSKKRVKALVAVGSAGAIAAGFHIPITAVVFTLEEVVGNLNAKVLGSIVISSVIASITAQFLTGGDALFSQLYYKLNDKRELIFYSFIGISSGLLGPLWMNSVLALRKFNRTKMQNHRLSFIMIAFCIVGLLSQIHPGVLGSGAGTIEITLLSLILDPKLLITLFVLKFFSTSLCYSTGMSGGLFMPTLLMGATLGSIIGSLAGILFPEITSNTGAYALVGMGAFFVTVIRTPFTSIMLVFELTRDYHIMLPLMIATAIAYRISSHYGNQSIYERISEQDGIHLPTEEDNEALETLPVSDAMVTDVKTLSANITINECVEEVRGSNITGYPVLKSGRLIGVVSKAEILTNFTKNNGDKKIESICEMKVIKIYPDQSLHVAFHRLKRFQISRLPVVSRLDDKKLVGIITAKEIVESFGFQIRQDNKSSEIIEKKDEDVISNS